MPGVTDGTDPLDLAALAADVRHRADEKRRGGLYDPALLGSGDEGSDPDPEPQFTVGPRHSAVAATAEIRPYAPLDAGRSVLARVAVAVKRGVRRALYGRSPVG